MEEKKKRFRPTLTAYRAQENEISKLKEELRLEEKSNDHLSEEVHRLRVRITELENLNEEQARTISLMEKRGFWARVFNR